MTPASVLRHLTFAVGSRLTRLSLRTLGFPRTITALDSVPRPFSHATTSPAEAVRWANEIDRVSQRPYGATCLDRSVFLWFAMRQRGLDGQIRIGVVFDDDRLDGHAWVELDGVVVNDDRNVAEQYVVFDEDPVGIVFS